ncbi:hypothetical protein SDC9_68713 [bioreactor metagenome]|uniref:Uncharacterized protein n=1 Tax=bioreactor metagenome TaxID=1076179 RepID=A0A644Y165_9ZZZZ
MIIFILRKLGIKMGDRKEESSYRKIDYSIRPAKSVERKMICDIIGRLAPIQKIDDYLYIGFGSVFFTDFILFHKTFGFPKMVSIEKDIIEEERFRFNQPYGCIDLKFGLSTKILPTLNWEKPVLMWLDYDDPINENVFTDIGYFCTLANPNSIIILTVNANVDRISWLSIKDTDKLAKERLKILEKQVSKERIPIGVTGEHLDQEGKYKILKRIIYNQINEDVSDRNGLLENGEKLVFHQLFNFVYQDGAKMLTVGGILIKESESRTFSELGFEKLPYSMPQEGAYEIVVPKLTFKEARYLDKLLPSEFEKLINEGENEANQNQGKICAKNSFPVNFLPKDDLDNYRKIYRYFPNFVESEIK